MSDSTENDSLDRLNDRIAAYNAVQDGDGTLQGARLRAHARFRREALEAEIADAAGSYVAEFDDVPESDVEAFYADVLRAMGADGQ